MHRNNLKSFTDESITRKSEQGITLQRYHERTTAEPAEYIGDGKQKMILPLKTLCHDIFYEWDRFKGHSMIKLTFIINVSTYNCKCNQGRDNARRSL